MRIILYARQNPINYEISRFVEEIKKRNIPYEFNTDVKNLLATDCIIIYNYDYGLRIQLKQLNLKSMVTIEQLSLFKDKWETYKIAVKNGINTPYTTLNEEDTNLVYPIVMKPRYGSMSRGIRLIEEPTKNRLFQSSPFFLIDREQSQRLYQNYIADSHGDHIRVMTSGGKIIGAMYVKAAEGDFISNIQRGSTATAYTLNEKEIEFVKRIIDVYHLNYSGIDLLKTDSGEIYFLEINGCAHFKGFEEATGINVAAAVIEELIGNESNNL